jgi:Fe-S-cluster-containing hydrogenase component 2
VVKNARFDIDYTICTGCDICAQECAAKFQPADVEGINIEYSRIRTMRFQYVDIPNVCYYCALTEWSDGTTEYPCQYVCPTDAIVTVPDEETVAGYYGNGYKRIIPELCVGYDLCTRCLEICEQLFGSGIIFKPDGIADVCTMCAGQPTCAEVCPEQCLDFVNVIPGRFYAMNPEHLAEILYARMYKIRRDL